MITLSFESLEIQIRNPVFGNTDYQENPSVIQKSRGLTTIYYSSDIKLIVQRMSLTFTDLTDTEKDNLMSFFYNTLGQEITLIDHLDRTWAGVLLSPNNEFTNTGRKNEVYCKTHNVSFEFGREENVILGSITLPNPDWSNTERLNTEINIHQMLSGSLYTYVKDSGKSIVSFTISKICITDKENFEDWFDTYAGSVISMTDWNGNLWSGILLTNPLVFTCIGRAGDPVSEIYSVSLQFEGVITQYYSS